jgi:hypothetical protein
MDQLIRFEESLQRATDEATLSVLQADRGVQALHSRLLSPNAHDSVETKVSIVGEMLYQMYLHLLAIEREKV